MKALRYVLVVVIYIVLLHVIGTSSAHAQTNTPTPTNTPIIFATHTPTPTPAGTATPTPGFTPTPPAAGSTVIWGCFFSNAVQTPTCTWGDYFEYFHADWLLASGAAVQKRWPGPDQTDEFFYVFIPPSNTKQIDFTCSLSVQLRAYEQGFSSAADARALGNINYNPTTWDLVAGTAIDRNHVVGASPNTGVGFDNGIETQSFSLRLDDSIASWPDTFPPVFASRHTYVSISGRLTLDTAGNAATFSEGVLRHACEINLVERLDGSTYVPTNPHVGDNCDEIDCDVTPTPCPEEVVCWGGGWPTPVSWVPATPDPIEFGVLPGETECVEFLPGFSGGSTVFGYTATVNLPSPYEFCAEQYSFALEFMGWDYAALMSAVASIGAFGILYGILKKG